MHTSMSLKYEPSSEPLHISAKWMFFNWLCLTRVDCQTILSLTCWVCGTHLIRSGNEPGRSKLVSPNSAFIDYKTSMITDEDPLRVLLFY